MGIIKLIRKFCQDCGLSWQQDEGAKDECPRCESGDIKSGIVDIVAGPVDAEGGV